MAALQITSVQAIEYTYEKLNYPGQSAQVTAYEINNNRQIVGEHKIEWPVEAFLYSGLSFNPLSAPQNWNNSARAINDKGYIIIHDEMSYNNVLYDGTNYTLLPFLGAATDMNNVEKIVYSARYNGFHRGFIYDYHTGITTQVDSPWPTFDFGITFNGINDSGVCVGAWQDPSKKWHGFTYDGAAFNLFDAPGEDYIYPMKINNSGTIVGWLYGGRGFVYDGSNFQVINYPGADSTEIYGFNDLGQIVGGYYEHGMKYGFVMTPVPLPAAFHLLGVGLGSLVLYGRRKRIAKR
jgi:uncharacterized membrane protein